MSRRKQANPKPAKRDSEFEELATFVQPLEGFLYVKELDEGSSAVFAKEDLDVGTVLGIYNGNISKSLGNSEYDGPEYFKINRFGGFSSVYVMLEDAGHWLKLVRSATTLEDANICLRLSGAEVICSVIQRISQGVELKVTCEITEQEILEPSSDISTSSENLRNDGSERTEYAGKHEPKCGAFSALIPPSSQSPNEMFDTCLTKTEELECVDVRTDNDNTADNFVTREAASEDSKRECETAVRKTSNCVLECMKPQRLVSPSVEPRGVEAMSKAEKDNVDVQMEAEGYLNSPISEGDESSRRSPDQDSNHKQIANIEQLYKCHLCSYYCYRHYALVKHLRLHDIPAFAETAPYQAESSYCEACNIHFMCADTFKVHKAMYCKYRHEMGTDFFPRLPAPDEEAPAAAAVKDVFIVPNALGSRPLNGVTSVLQPQAIYAAVSKDPLVLVPCSLIKGQSLVPQNGVIPTGPPLILPNGVATIIENGNISQIGAQQHDKTVGLIPDNVVSLTSSNSSATTTAQKDSLCSFAKYQEQEVLNLKKSSPLRVEKIDVEEKRETDVEPQDAPLDLTIRKRKSSCFETRSERTVQQRRRRNSFTSVSPTTPPLQFAATRSSSPEPTYSILSERAVTVSSPAYSNDASSSSGFGSAIPIPTVQANGIHAVCKIPDRSSPAPPVLVSALENGRVQPPMLPLGVPPPALMKQGNNRCEDCSIVFYIYDNYLAHKRNYCAFRQKHLASATESQSTVSDVSSPEDNNSNHGVSDVQSKINVPVDEKPFSSISLQRRNMDFGGKTMVPPAIKHKSQSSVYRCDDCGVKFSTADNLNAHQTFYCSMRGNFAYGKLSSQLLRRNSRSNETVCLPGGDPNVDMHEGLCCPEEWKCNYCDVVCPSLKSARRHLLTHSEIRGFCCIVCGYRGNTLRGMRTHVYEHLNGNASQIDDILASSVVVDPSGATSHGSHVISGSDDESNTETEINPTALEETSMKSQELTHFEAAPSELLLKRERFIRHTSTSDDGSGSPKRHSVLNESYSSNLSKNDHLLKQHVEQLDDSQKVACRETSQADCSKVLNPMSVCDVVIKAEDEGDFCEKIVPDRFESSPPTVSLKVDPDVQEGDERNKGKEKNETSHRVPTSVICRMSTYREKNQVKQEKDEEAQADEQAKHHSRNLVPKKRTRSQPKTGPELKYCKSCDISFHHLSNFVAHKKFYCVSRVIENFQQETAAVQ